MKKITRKKRRAWKGRGRRVLGGWGDEVEIRAEIKPEETSRLRD